jgi:DHA1 family bicyclomycin/chloramphenicol resistance-like MFS transporter
MRLTPGHRGFIVFLGALAAMAPIGWDIIMPAMPGMARAFGVEAAGIQPALSVYAFGFAVGQLFWGAVADRFGRRVALFGGMGLFTLAGIGCALAPSLGTLIVLRFVEGFGGCAGIVMARAIVRDTHSGADGARALSFVTLVQGAVPLTAPSLGGFLVVWFDWPATFVALALAGAAMLAAVAALLPETLRHPDPRALQFGRMTANWARFLRNPRVRVWTATNCVLYAGVFAYISGSPFAIQVVHGVPPNRFGLYFLFAAAALPLGSWINALLLRRMAQTRIMMLGYAGAILAGLIMLYAGFNPQLGPLWLAVPPMLYIMGYAMVVPNAIAQALEPFPDMAGNASALIGFLQNTAGALAGLLVAAAFDGTAVPLALIILGCGLAGAVLFALRPRGAQR